MLRTKNLGEAEDLTVWGGSVTGAGAGRGEAAGRTAPKALSSLGPCMGAQAQGVSLLRDYLGRPWGSVVGSG